MKFSSLTLTALLASVANGFTVPTQQTSVGGRRHSVATTTRRHLSSNTPDDVEALRKAAAKAREEAAQLARQLGKPVEEEKKKVVVKSKSADEISQLTSSIDFEGGDALSQTQQLDNYVQSGDLSKWKSTDLRTFPVSLNMLEQRSGGKVTGESLGVAGGEDVNLDDFKYATLGVTAGSTVLAIGSLAFLPENIGPTLCYFFALVPIIFLGIGSSAPGIIAGAIASARGTADTDEQKLDRICRHEAGHFLCGYLCGLPIRRYSLLDGSGIPCVEFHSASDGGVSRELTPEEIAALSVVAMSGSVAEVLALGEAKGGQNDLLELEGLFRQSKEFIGAAKQQDLTRWGALQSYNLLKQNEAKYEKLVQAFKDQKSVAECVAIIEGQ